MLQLLLANTARPQGSLLPSPNPHQYALQKVPIDIYVRRQVIDTSRFRIRSSMWPMRDSVILGSLIRDNWTFSKQYGKPSVIRVVASKCRFTCLTSHALCEPFKVRAFSRLEYYRFQNFLPG